MAEYDTPGTGSGGPLHDNTNITSGLIAPSDLAFDSAGNLWVIDGGGSSGPAQLVKYSSGQLGLTTGVPIDGLSTGLNGPVSLAIAPFPHADISYPNGAIVNFSGSGEYVFAGGFPFLVPSRASSARTRAA